MPPKSFKQLAKDQARIRGLKWEFLRRNSEYIADCEKFSLRKRNLWKKSEIILGFEFRGKIHNIIFDKTFKSKSLWGYYEKISNKWNVIVGEGREWEKYRAKWQINFPLNPDCNYVPFFVSVAEANAVEEIVTSGRIENQLFSKRLRNSSVNINWTKPKEILMYEFEKLIDIKHECLLEQSKNMKPQIEKFEEYIQIYDFRVGCGKKYAEIADYIITKGENFESVLNRVKRNFKVASSLVKGGYKQLGDKF